MTETFNIYCDESCHLEHDGHRSMVLGAVWCPAAETRAIAERLRVIKAAHGLPADFEVKWTKVSPAKIDFYLALVDYFFAEPSLHFRALIVPDKAALDHDSFNQDHDTWYYKMYFDLLKLILDPHARYRIYLDVKDTRSAPKERRLREVLSNNLYDFQREIIERLQAVRSHEVEQIQLTDLLTGIVSYANRELHSSPAKAALVRRMRERSGYELTRSTLFGEQKVNLFRWRPRLVAV